MAETRNEPLEQRKNWAHRLAEWSDPNSLKSPEEHRSDALAARQQSLLNKQLAAAVRSLSGQADVSANIADAVIRQGASHRAPQAITRESLPAVRGRLDSSALYKRFHSADVHAHISMEDVQRQRLFDMLEAWRCDCLGANLFPGVKANLVASHRDRLIRTDLIGAHLASLVPLVEALEMVVRDTLTAATEPSIASSGFWMWDRWLRARIAPQLDQLNASQHDQQAFGIAALELIKALFDALESSNDGNTRRPLKSGGNATESQTEDGLGESEASSEDNEFVPGSDIFPDGAVEKIKPVIVEKSQAQLEPYAIFSTRHDKVVDAEQLGRVDSLREARKRLEQKRAEFRRETSRLVAQLQRRLMARQNRSWTFDLEEGLIDSSRLDRVVVNPGFSDAFKQEDESNFLDTCVTLLIDNSGSMRGKPIEIACLVAELTSAALERVGVPTEVLGFTTAHWQGGDSYKDWARAGKPSPPGRLNDLLHIIYKPADRPLRTCRDHLAAMLSRDVLKENIDGEALAWAARRISSRPERRRILIVISDGAPVDQATLENNTNQMILDTHLRQIIGEIERGDSIELAAIGIKHDVSNYYKRAVRIEKPEELSAKLVALLDSFLSR